jgi:hypothetical protein
MTSKIKTILAVGLVAAFASPAFALDVEANPVASGRYIAGTPGPFVSPISMAYAEATKPTHATTSWEERQFERAVGGIR